MNTSLSHLIATASELTPFRGNGCLFLADNEMMDSGDFLQIKRRETGTKASFAQFEKLEAAKRSFAIVKRMNAIPFVRESSNKPVMVHMFVAITLGRWCSPSLGDAMDAVLYRMMFAQQERQQDQQQQNLATSTHPRADTRKRPKTIHDDDDDERDNEASELFRKCDSAMLQCVFKELENEKLEKQLEESNMELQQVRDSKEKDIESMNVAAEKERLEKECIQQKFIDISVKHQQCESKDAELQALKQQGDANKKEIERLHVDFGNEQIDKEAYQKQYLELQSEKERAEPVVRSLMFNNQMLQSQQTFLKSRLESLPEDIDVLELQRRLDVAVSDSARARSTILEIEKKHDEQLSKLRVEMEHTLQKQKDDMTQKHEDELHELREKLHSAKQQHSQPSEDHVLKLKMCETMKEGISAISTMVLQSNEKMCSVMNTFVTSQGFKHN